MPSSKSLGAATILNWYDPASVFCCQSTQTDATKRLLSVSVSFAKFHSAQAFVVKVDSYSTSRQHVALPFFILGSLQHLLSPTTRILGLFLNLLNPITFLIMLTVRRNTIYQFGILNCWVWTCWHFYQQKFSSSQEKEMLCTNIKKHGNLGNQMTGGQTVLGNWFMPSCHFCFLAPLEPIPSDPHKNELWDYS